MLRLVPLAAAVAWLAVTGTAVAADEAPPFHSTYTAKLHVTGVHSQSDRYEHSGSGYDLTSSGAFTIDAKIDGVAFMGHRPAGNGAGEIEKITANGSLRQHEWDADKDEVTNCTGDAFDDPIGTAAMHGPEPTTAGVPVEWFPAAYLNVPLHCTGADPGPGRSIRFSEDDHLFAHYLVPLAAIHSPSFTIPIRSLPNACLFRNDDTKACRDTWNGTVTYTRTSIERIPGTEPEPAPSPTPTPEPEPEPTPGPTPPKPPRGGAVLVGGHVIVPVTCTSKCSGTVTAKKGKKAIGRKKFKRAKAGTTRVRVRVGKAAKVKVVVAMRTRGKLRTRAVTVTR